MARKSGTDGGVFASLGRALDDTMEMAMAARGGRMSGPEFERWWRRRADDNRKLMESVRDRARMIAQPPDAVLDAGKAVLKTAATMGAGRGTARRVRRRRRSAARPASARRETPRPRSAGRRGVRARR